MFSQDEQVTMLSDEQLAWCREHLPRDVALWEYGILTGAELEARYVAAVNAK